jgi:hypothetical protein
MSRSQRTLSLARQTARSLALVGLMLLAAQTYSEPPPETRLDFQIELAATHQLRLRSRLPKAHEIGNSGLALEGVIPSHLYPLSSEAPKKRFHVPGWRYSPHDR